MSYIFLDESGDLGFDFSKKKTSKYFVVTFLLTDDKVSVERLIKKVFKGFSKKQIQSHSGVLHAYKELSVTRQKLLTSFASKKYGTIITIYLDKRKVYTKLKDEKHVLYNYVTNILLDRVYTKKLIPIDQKICVIAAKRETNKFLNENFSNYLKQQANGNHKLDIEVHIKNPSD